jgi:hypothetical protein
MDWLSLLLIFVASTIVSIMLRPKIKDTSSPGDFRPPEPREGEPIPVVFGTALVSPAVTWFGDVDAKKVKKTVSSVFGLVQDDVPLGYDYYAGMMLTLCHGPIGALLDIYIGEKRVVRQAKWVGDGTMEPPPLGWPDPSFPSLPQEYNEHPTRVSLNLPTLFGGPEEGGGVVGQLDIHWGSNVQGPNDYLAVWWGVDILPNYRNLAYVVLRRMNMGKSPTPSPWKFVIKRIPDGLDQTDYTEIGDGTANGAEILYEILTHRIWGLGKPSTDIDVDSFKTAAETLHDEGLGYSGVMADKSEAWQKIQDILNHINGVVFQHPLTGLISIKLIRDDYVLNDLVELDESNSIIDEYKRGSWAETVNETQVQFTDAARRFSDAAAQAQNIAAITLMDEVISNTISLPGLTTHSLAQKAAERSNRATSYPLTRCRIRTNRIAYAFHPGMPFKLTYADYGLSESVFRVVSVNYGSLVDGMIEINSVEDLWDLDYQAYADPDDLEDLEPCGPLPLLVTGYDPGDDPAAVYGNGLTKIFEVPYWHVGAYGRAWVHQSRGNGNDLYWEAWVAIQGVNRNRIETAAPFNATGYLEELLPQTGQPLSEVKIQVYTAGEMNTLTSTDADGLWVGERLLMIDDEIMAWRTVTDLGDGLYEIGGILRGQLDTGVEEHLAGTPVYFYYNSDGADSAIDVSGEDLDAWTQVDVWSLIVFGDGTKKDLNNVPKAGVLITERALAPLPPGNIKIGGAGYAFGYQDWPAVTLGNVTLSWSNRNRSEQTTMVAHDDPSQYTQEGTFTIQVLLNGVKVREWTSVTGNSQEYTWAQRITDDARYSLDVQFRIIPIGTGGEQGVTVTTPAFVMDPT